MKNPFQRWNGKITMKALVFQGHVKTDVEIDGKITLPEFQAALLMMMAHLGRHSENLIAQQEGAARKAQLEAVKAQAPAAEPGPETPPPAKVVELRPDDRPKWEQKS